MVSTRFFFFFIFACTKKINYELHRIHNSGFCFCVGFLLLSVIQLYCLKIFFIVVVFQDPKKEGVCYLNFLSLVSETSSSVQWKLDLSSTCYTSSLRHTHMHTRIHSHRHRHFSFPVSVKVGLPFYNRSVPLAWRFQSSPSQVLDERNIPSTPPPSTLAPPTLN